MPQLSLIVLRTSRTADMLSFYRTLGLSFRDEQHGKGPVHHSAQLGAVLIEIYPGTEGTAPERGSGGATMLGILVESLDATLARLSDLGVGVALPPKDGPWGRRAVVMDPDGRSVELVEKNAEFVVGSV